MKEAIELYLEPVKDDWILNEDVAVEEVEL